MLSAGPIVFLYSITTELDLPSEYFVNSACGEANLKPGLLQRYR